MENLPLMIFAAGFGTRMKHLTRTRPKPMIQVAGRTLIDRALDLADEAQAGPVVVNTHYLAEIIETHLAGRGPLISRETPDILDTGGGLRNALPLIDAQVVATLNPDVVWSGPNPLTLLRHAWDPRRMDALLMCVPLAQTIGRQGGGDFSVSPNGRVNRKGDLVYGGAQIIKADTLHRIQDRAFSLNQVWDQLIARDRLSAIAYPGRWCDVGTPEGIALAEGMLSDHV